MTSKQAEKVLTYVAQHSPKKFAAVIKDRNMQLLHLLNVSQEDKVYVGCPHCHFDGRYRCDGCLWVEAMKAARAAARAAGETWLACTHVPFNGVALRDVSKDSNDVRVSYGHDYAKITLRDSNEVQRDECRRFLEGHIEWASRDDWGSKYKERTTHAEEKS